MITLEKDALNLIKFEFNKPITPLYTHHFQSSLFRITPPSTLRQLYILLWFFLTKCKTFQLSLLKCLLFLFAQFSILSPSTWILFLFSRVLAILPRLVTSINMWRLLKSFIKKYWATLESSALRHPACYISPGTWETDDKYLSTVYQPDTWQQPPSSPH